MFWTYLTTLLLLGSGCFLMLIVLLQRGRGGGLAGAFGGLGGQSAFGTKAGDVFTKVTVVVALLWVVMACVTGFAMRRDARGQRFEGGADSAPEEPTMKSTPGAEPVDDPFADQDPPAEDGETVDSDAQTGAGETSGDDPPADDPGGETTSEGSEDAEAADPPEQTP